MITIDFNKLNLEPGGHFLDIGCGEGRHMVEACRQNKTHCMGGDYGYDNLVFTRDKLHFHEAIDDLKCSQWALSTMDATALPFQDAQFDAVVCSEVLEHIPDDDTAIDELVRITKPGKILAVSVPRSFPEKICWHLSDEYFNANMGHVRIYDKTALIQKIQSRGMTHFASHFAHSIHTPYWWLKCLVGPNRTDSWAVNLYHRFLVWDLMKQPRFTRTLDQFLNPILGKSIVLYFKKHQG
ncbi:MAG: class I SAM-dependent methyltransferase [Desulfobacterales bacterium]|nr:class I SAM-dependent methyltransferase [Desulfobacterales bacterium]